MKFLTGSQLAWATNPRELPFWTYDEPYLIRDKNWLRSWGGKMLIMCGISNVRLIDACASDAFKKEYLDSAQNIPGEVFVENLNSLKICLEY